MKQKHYAVLVAAILSGCASTEEMANVIPGEGGVYEVVATGEDKQETLSSALSAAEATCERRQMRFVVIDREETFKGVLPVDSDKRSDQAAEIAATSTVQYVPILSGDGDYRLTMKFKCEA